MTLEADGGDWQKQQVQQWGCRQTVMEDLMFVRVYLDLLVDLCPYDTWAFKVFLRVFIWARFFRVFFGFMSFGQAFICFGLCNGVFHFGIL